MLEDLVAGDTFEDLLGEFPDLERRFAGMSGIRRAKQIEGDPWPRSSCDNCVKMNDFDFLTCAAAHGPENAELTAGRNGVGFPPMKTAMRRTAP
jgi:hypothetical protein